ncbi:MAG: hypothetical protein HC789_10930 [Microcoleus sp. CSU_2_2]|nr:hypothetical protein [Microcoleus sp. SU_5_3]NJS10836.1 hypothetical protein [Microcoleus sp. CSU_2_2]
MEDVLRSEYDLKSLRVRKLGPGRKIFRGLTVHLEPDVAEMFPDKAVGHKEHNTRYIGGGKKVQL